MPAEKSSIPTHLGLIMDGNRRWAKAKGLDSLEGHLAGQKALREVVYRAVEKGVKYISAYAFSTENWSRTEREVGYLMGQVAKALERYADELIEHDIKVLVLGTRQGLPKKVATAIDIIEQKTAHGNRATFAICFNYGGHVEITDALKSIIGQRVIPDEITPELIAKNLYHPDIPPVDLVVRTSGEQRLSNFMLWRAAYSEFIFRDELWPDFTVDVLDDCLVEYGRRQRRFGG